FRAVQPATEDRPAAQHRRPAAVGALHIVIAGARGDVQPAARAEGQAAYLMRQAAEALDDHFADVVGPARFTLLVSSHGAAAGEVEPAVVYQQARRQLVLQDQFGLVVGPFPA